MLPALLIRLDLFKLTPDQQVAFLGVQCIFICQFYFCLGCVLQILSCLLNAGRDIRIALCQFVHFLTHFLERNRAFVKRILR